MTVTRRDVLLSGEHLAAALVTTNGSSAARPLGARFADVANVKDFGAKGDGITDDTGALRVALAAAGNHLSFGVHGCEIIFPPGEYVISDTLVLTQMSGVLRGSGIGNSPCVAGSPGKATVIRWNGAANVPMIQIKDSKSIDICNIRFEGRDGIGGTTAINFLSSFGDGAGTNENLHVDQCYFGRYPWTSQGISKGDLANGILFSGDNINNDEFCITRCIFSNCDNAGINIINTQSIWGSINNCVFRSCRVGILTASTTNIYNAAFDACNPDINILSTAKVTVFGWYSERARQLAKLSVDANLTVYGGLVDINDIDGYESGVKPGIMIDAFPSHSVEIKLYNVRFRPTEQNPPAIIKFGASQQDSVTGNFKIELYDVDLSPSQVSMAGALWAAQPECRGEITFVSRPYAFRNYLRYADPTRRTVDTSKWDLAPAVTPPILVATGPLAIENTAATVYAGAGSPEGAVTAVKGSLYLRIDGGQNTTLYVKEGGTGSTGWVGK